MKTGKIIRKNIKLLLRSRVSTLVLIFGPLLVILLVGISFSTNSFNLNMGIYSDKYSNLSNSFVDKLSQEGYKVTKYNSETQCISSVKEGQTHACIVISRERKKAWKFAPGSERNWRIYSFPWTAATWT